MQSNMNLINGHFITLEHNSDDINSITIENGKIKAFNSPNSNFETIDVKKNIVIPGFIDSHFHLKNYGKRKDMINLKKIASIDKIVKLIKQKINEHPDIKWIEGFGWDHNLWDGQYPNSEILNSISDNHAIVLTRIDGHSMWVNDVAIKESDYSVEELDVINGASVINEFIFRTYNFVS